MSRTIKNNKIEKYCKSHGILSQFDKDWIRWKKRRKSKVQRIKNKKLIEYKLNELNYVW